MNIIIKNSKRLLTFILAFILVVNIIVSFSAIVSDNDGSAFVTKGEFEAMKLSFDSQISNYENSLSSKIDGSIASYLAGLQVSKTETRTQLISGCDSWLMYNEKTYPTNEEGKPYLTGYTVQGNFCTSTGSTKYCLFVGMQINGYSTLATNGGFKKHIVGKPSNNNAKNGNTDYVAEWQGYYQKEAEKISLANYGTNVASDPPWAADDQDRIRWFTMAQFKNADCPCKVGDIRFANSSGSHWTGLEIYASTAQRIAGEIVGDTYVSIYKDINDTRFYDSTSSNKVGITPTGVAGKDITCGMKGSDYVTYIPNVIDSVDYKWACNRKSYDATNGYINLDGTTANYAKTTNTSYQSVDSTTGTYYLIQMANDTHNLKFSRLWSAKTDGLASKLEAKMNDAKTSAAEKDTIKAGLLWDSDGTAHLSMGAGYPFLEVQKGEKVAFSFKIPEAGEYLVYAKYGPFSKTGDAETEADVTFKKGTDTAHPKAFKANGGLANNKFEFDVENDGYIFLKWCNKADTQKSGTMDVSVDPVVQLKD